MVQKSLEASTCFNLNQLRFCIWSQINEKHIKKNQKSKTTYIKLYAGALEKDLAEIKAECEAQNKHQEVAAREPLKSLHKSENKAQEVTALAPQPLEKIVQSELDVQTHRQKVRQAQVWLKNLDKNSDERDWFEQFAFKYSSRIDAAIDYLQAVNEFDWKAS